MTSMSTKQLLVELEALALRFDLQRFENQNGQYEARLDAASDLLRQAIRRIEQLTAMQNMAADQ